jgi:hypothetical protein
VAHVFRPEAFSLKGEELADTTALLFGRRSYEAFAPFWRDSDDHAGHKDLPKYVLSTTLGDDAIVDGWVSGSSAPASTRVAVGTGAVPVLVSGPETDAYGVPSCSQNTRPQLTVATEVICVTCSLVQVHTESTHGESDRRVSNRSFTGRRVPAVVPGASADPGRLGTIRELI